MLVRHDALLLHSDQKALLDSTGLAVSPVVSVDLAVALVRASELLSSLKSKCQAFIQGSTKFRLQRGVVAYTTLFPKREQDSRDAIRT